LKKLFKRYSHWLLLLLVGGSMIMSAGTLKAVTQDMVVIGFGIIGLLGVTYLAFRVESRISSGE
jgi:CHASE2 domain-containing sensor protein